MEALSDRWNATSLRTKMTALSVLLLALGLLVAGLGSMSVLRDYLTQNTDDRINSLLNNLPQQFVEVIDN